MGSTTEMVRPAKRTRTPRAVNSGGTMTTGQVAKVCSVASKTVCDWVDAGRFAGAYRIPGGSDRRIPTQSVIAFMKANGLPLGRLLRLDGCRVLVASADPLLAGRLAEAVGSDFAVQSEDNLFGAAVGVCGFMPSVVVFDFNLGSADECRSAALALGRIESVPGVRVIVIVGEDYPDVPTGFTAVFRRGEFGVEELARTVCGLFISLG